MQLSLEFPNLPSPTSVDPELWQRLDETKRQAVLECLARLMAQTVLDASVEEEPRDE